MKTFLPVAILGLFILLAKANAATHSGYCLYTNDFTSIKNAKVGIVSGKTAEEAQNNCANAVRKELGLKGEAEENVVPASDLNPKLDEYDLKKLTAEGKIITILGGEPAKKI